MVWVLGAWYLRKSDREFDPLAERAAKVALEAAAAQRRFEPEAAQERRGRDDLVAAVNETALAVFGVIVAVTLVVSWFASSASTRPPTSGPPAAA